MDNLCYKEGLLLSSIEGSIEPTTVEIIRKSGLSKVTALKYLKKLTEKKIIEYRRIGPAKVWSMRRRDRVQMDFNHLKPRISKLLHEFEELTGSKANIIVETDGPAITTKLIVK